MLWNRHSGDGVMSSNGDSSNRSTDNPVRQQQLLQPRRQFPCLTVLLKKSLEAILHRSLSLLVSCIASAWAIQPLTGSIHAAIAVFAALVPCCCIPAR